MTDTLASSGASRNGLIVFVTGVIAGVLLAATVGSMAPSSGDGFGNKVSVSGTDHVRPETVTNDATWPPKEMKATSLLADGDADTTEIIKVEVDPKSVNCDDLMVIKARKLSLREGPERWGLGVQLRDEPPLGRGSSCKSPSAVMRLVGPDGAQVTRGPQSVPEECMAKLEALNPHVPLRNTEKCAQHNRRFDEKKVFEQHMDHDETERRTTSAVLLASVCPPGAKQRKIFFDAGCRKYDSSTLWLRKKYPGGAAFDVHAIDVVATYRWGFLNDKKAAFYHAAVWNESGFMTFVSKKGLEADGFFHTRWDDMPRPRISTKLTTVPTFAFGDFIMKRSTPEDFVVVKIDVEGAEWVVVEQLAKSGALQYIDELFLECHHAEWVPAWPSQHSLGDCHRMFNALRKAGVFAHEWY